MNTKTKDKSRDAARERAWIQCVNEQPYNTRQRPVPSELFYGGYDAGWNDHAALAESEGGKSQQKVVKREFGKMRDWLEGVGMSTDALSQIDEAIKSVVAGSEEIK